VDVTLDGGNGNDQIALTSGGYVNGTFDATVDGGGGNDKITADVDTGEGTGQLVLAVSGGDKNDNITASVRSDGTVDASVDGGSGNDKATVTDNVTLTNVENVKKAK
jgi:hypothetical protein